MKTLYVKDLSSGMTLTQEGFAIKSLEVSQTKDNKPYYSLFLIDKTGEVKGKIWSESLKKIDRKLLKIGTIILIDALVEDYRGTLQLNIFNAQRVDETALSDYMEASDFKIDDMWDDLNKYISNIENKEIKNFLNSLFSDKEIVRKYKSYPAAEFVHHTFQGGLLEHVVEMLDCAQPLRKYYPEADFDLITAGIILHDIGKINELEPAGVAVQRTTEGYLIGHLINSFEVLTEKGKELSPRILMNLKHIVLSHHGYLEFGSPKIPATIEANIVTYLDQMSSKTRIFQKIIRRNSNNNQLFTEFDSYIGTKIYLGNLNKNDSSPEQTFL